MAEGSRKNDNLPSADDKDELADNEEKGGLQRLREFFAEKLTISSQSPIKSPSNQKLSELSLQGVANYIQSEQCKNIVVMCGAGISTSAGIPDFRSPNSGLYANLQQFNLPDPQCIFEISFFKTDPRPFFTLAKALYPKILKPTPSHYFISMLNEKKLLLRTYTQNIDTLERIAGVPHEKLVEAHGTFHTSHCLRPNCQKEYSLEWMKEKIFADETPKCPDCGEVVKPDIVFFGENLPSRFFELVSEDFPKCDLLIVMGTSLVVQPFASLVSRVPKDTPRLLINKEKTGRDDPISRLMGMGCGMDFDSEDNVRDVAWLGLCDEGCEKLADLLGWGDEFRTRVKTEHLRIDDAQKSNAKLLDKKAENVG